MAGGEFSDAIRRFIHDSIHSVEQLEVLLLLADSAEQEWNAAQVSQKLYTQPESVAMRLADLHARGLLTIGSAPGLYRYVAPTPALDEVVRDLDLAYKERKDAVIGAIFSRPLDDLRTFSDAFRIRRKD